MIQFALLHTRVDKFLIKKDVFKITIETIERVVLNQKEHTLNLI